MPKRFFAFIAIFAAMQILFAPSVRQLTAAEQSAKISEIAFQPIGKKDVVYERFVEKGVIHRREWRKSGPLLLNAIMIDRNQAHLKLETEKGKKSLFQGEKVAAMSERESRSGHLIVAAVNADFWGNSHIPIGIFVDDGTIYKGPHPERSAFVINKSGEPFIIRSDMKTSLKIAELEFPLSGINLKEDKDAVIYTERFGKELKFDAPRIIFKMRQIDDEFIPNQSCHVVVDEIVNDASKISLQSGYLYLAVKSTLSKKFEQHLKLGAKGAVLARMASFDEPIAAAVGGGPRILRDGKVSVELKEEGISESFSTTKHPRTAIGFSKDKSIVYLATVDGRQPAISIGHSLVELAQYMKELGAWDAMNLDGGGSTTMWVRGEIVNKPSDATGPRTVTNALLLASSAAAGGIAQIRLEPRNLRIPPLSQIPLTVLGYDAHFNPVQIEQSEIKWEITDGLGEINNSILHLRDSATMGSVAAMIKGATISDAISIEVSPVEKIEVYPDLVLMKSGQTRTLEITAFDKNDNELNLFSSMIRAEGTDGVQWLSAANSITGTNAGKHSLVISIGSQSRNVPVYVDYFQTKNIESFDAITDFKISTQSCDESETKVLLESSVKKEGAAAARINYKMKSGGTSAVYLDINRPIPAQPFNIGVWVYGDGKEQWLRGVILDKDGEEFIADFTEGTRGIFWKDEWRYLEVPLTELSAKWSNPAARLDYPLTLKQLYLVQTREDKKSSGSIILDAFSAEYPRD